MEQEPILKLGIAHRHMKGGCPVPKKHPVQLLLGSLVSIHNQPDLILFAEPFLFNKFFGSFEDLGRGTVMFF